MSPTRKTRFLIRTCGMDALAHRAQIAGYPSVTPCFRSSKAALVRGVRVCSGVAMFQILKSVGLATLRHGYLVLTQTECWLTLYTQSARASSFGWWPLPTSLQSEPSPNKTDCGLFYAWILSPFRFDKSKSNSPAPPKGTVQHSNSLLIIGLILYNGLSVTHNRVTTNK